MTQPTIQPLYASFTTVTISLASLGTSSTFVAGQEATAPTANSTSLYDDVFLTGKITVGTTPTVNTQILVYVFGALDASPTWPDVFTGSNAAATLTSVGIGMGFLQTAATLIVDATTSNRTYPFGPISLAQLFGGNIPQNWSIFVTHNTGVNLNSTAGNHFVKYQGVNYVIPTV